MQRMFIVQVFAAKRRKERNIEASSFLLLERWKALFFVKDGIKMKLKSSKSSNESCTVLRMLRQFSIRLNPSVGWGNWNLQMRKPYCWGGVRNYWAISGMTYERCTLRI